MSGWIEYAKLTLLAVTSSIGFFMIGVYAYEAFGIGKTIFGTHDFLDSEIVYLPLAAAISCMLFARKQRPVKIVFTTFLSCAVVSIAAIVLRMNEGLQITCLFAAIPVAVVFAVAFKGFEMARGVSAA